ncbi:DUF6387 family protein [Yersinia enterocolitica]
MKNWSVEHTKEIKEWLNIDTYRKFDDISLNALYHELWARALWFKEWPTEEEIRDLIQYGKKIFSGNPFLFKPEQLNYITRDDCLYSPPHVHITAIDRLAQLSVNALRAGLFFWENGSDEYRLNAAHHEDFVSEIMSPLCEKTVLLEIDLGSGTDEEIAESVKTALPQWRKIKAIEPDLSGAVRFGYGTIKKLITYRVMAMLDILMWAKIHKVRISDDRLSRLLYTDEDEENETRLNHHIRDSDRPLAKKAATISFIRQFNFFLNKNPHLKDMKVSEVMKIND